ncbi:MAG: hypothetical protein AAGA85_13005, partial [Bacteroidota bacterium]
MQVAPITAALKQLADSKHKLAHNAYGNIKDILKASQIREYQDKINSYTRWDGIGNYYPGSIGGGGNIIGPDSALWEDRTWF